MLIDETRWWNLRTKLRSKVAVVEQLSDKNIILSIHRSVRIKLSVYLAVQNTH